jgi:hypothetical protein
VAGLVAAFAVAALLIPGDDRDAATSLLAGVAGSLALAAGCFLVNLIRAPLKLHQAADRRATAAEAKVQAYEAKAPKLSFGRAEIPERSQRLDLLDKRGRPFTLTGRVIRVPVMNAQSAGDAHRVRARLRFLPDDTHRSFAPRDDAQGEWMRIQGGPEIEITTLPGNGRPRLLDVAVVIEGEYPNVYEWTTRSRAAALAGYAIKANPVTVEIEVMGGGPEPTAPHLKRRLNIDIRSGQLRADWLDASDDEATNWVAWSSRGT